MQIQMSPETAAEVVSAAPVYLQSPHLQLLQCFAPNLQALNQTGINNFLGHSIWQFSQRYLDYMSI